MAKENYQKILSLGFPFEVLNRDLRLIFASNLIGSFGDGLYAYLLPYYMSETLHASSVEIGILYAVVSLVAALSGLVAGMLADRYDRKKIMIVGWIAWVPAPLILSFARNWLQMLPGIFLWGVWLGGPTTIAYIMTTANKSKLALTFTAISSAWSIGYIFSPALGGYLAGTVGMRIVFFSAFILYALACLTLVFISSQKTASHTQYSSKEHYSFIKLLKNRKLLQLSVFLASIIFVLMMFRPFVPKFLGETYGYDSFKIGVLGSVSFFGSAVLAILLGKLADKRKKSYALSISMLLSSLSIILLLLFNDFQILIVTFFAAGSSYIAWSLMNAIIAPLAPESIRAKWASIPQTIGMFSSFIAPYVGGILYDISPYYLFVIAIAATFLLALLASLSKA